MLRYDESATFVLVFFQSGILIRFVKEFDEVHDATIPAGAFLAVLELEEAADVAGDDDFGVVLEVEDTGPGVRPTDEPRLFEPFFTTKPVGHGTGLGLSISYGIVESLGGSIGHRPAPVRGAIFYFELPAAHASVAATPASV